MCRHFFSKKFLSAPTFSVVQWPKVLRFVQPNRQICADMYNVKKISLAKELYVFRRKSKKSSFEGQVLQLKIVRQVVDMCPTEDGEKRNKTVNKCVMTCQWWCVIKKGPNSELYFIFSQTIQIQRLFSWLFNFKLGLPTSNKLQPYKVALKHNTSCLKLGDCNFKVWHLTNIE